MEQAPFILAFIRHRRPLREQRKRQVDGSQHHRGSFKSEAGCTSLRRHDLHLGPQCGLPSLFFLRQDDAPQGRVGSLRCPVECPSEIRFFTSDGLFRDIEARRRENRILREEKEAAYKDRREKAGQRYRFSSLEDLDGLKERNAALRSTERQWAERLGKAEEERSNGESSLDVFASILDNPGLYLVDEPENCLSPLNQSRLATLLFDAAFHNRSQLIVASHSPFILAIPGAKVIDLDEEPPREKKWTELPNMRLYRDFFLSHAKDFD